jgi:hypothetical protein
MTPQAHRKELSRVWGCRYVVFDSEGLAYGIPSRSMNLATVRAAECDGEVWHNGRVISCADSRAIQATRAAALEGLEGKEGRHDT